MATTSKTGVDVLLLPQKLAQMGTIGSGKTANSAKRTMASFAREAGPSVFSIPASSSTLSMAAISVVLVIIDLFFEHNIPIGAGFPNLLVDYMCKEYLVEMALCFICVCLAAGGRRLHLHCVKKPTSGRSDSKTSTDLAIARNAALLKRREIVACKEALEEAAHAGDSDKAIQVIFDQEKRGYQIDVYSYNLTIRAFAKQGRLRDVERWVDRMEKNGVEPTVCTYNIVLNGCAKSGKSDACGVWIDRLIAKGLRPTVVTFATSIYSCARHGDISGAEHWMQTMIEKDIQPDAVSFNSLIHACGVAGDADRAEKWLKEMLDRSLQPTVTTFTALIDGCAKSCDCARAERWHAKMQEIGLLPNVITFSCLIDACAKSGNLTRAEHWHDRMIEAGISPNAHSYSAIINACAKSASHRGGGPEAAERWLQIAEKRGIHNDVVVYNSVIDACGRAGDSDRAMAIFNRMEAKGMTVGIVAYATLARPFAYKGDWRKVEAIADRMSKGGVKPNEYFLYAHILAYAIARPQQTQRAEAVFREAIGKGLVANNHVTTALVRAVGRERCDILLDELSPVRNMVTVQRPSNRRLTCRAGKTVVNDRNPQEAKST